MIEVCRICSGIFFPEPLAVYHNMPALAQHLPEQADLPADSGVDLHVSQCSCCGLIQLQNAPVHYYREVIRSSAFSAEMKAFRVKQFANWVRTNDLEQKKIIEIGCGGGEFLDILKKTGAQVYGLEYSEKLIKACHKKNLRVQKGYLGDADCQLTEGPFEAFIILNWLEHLPDLNTVLRKLATSLTDNAVGLVEVPNFDMIQRNNAFSEFIVDHLYYFTAKTLTRTLEINGFAVTSCREIWHDYVLSAEVKKTPRLELAGFRETQEKLLHDLKKFLAPYDRAEVVIWGASHQAFTVMALAQLQDKVSFVVDSASFKQGRYTPVSHLPILAPESLQASVVRAVIVMASSYSDEVLGIIRERFGNKIRVAILRENKLEVCDDQ